MLIHERIEAYKAAGFPCASAPWLVQEGTPPRDVLYAVWAPGADYRAKTPFYGAYPPGYVARVMALFPDVGDRVLHLFSGSLPPGPYERCDLVQDAELRCSVYDLPNIVLNRRPRLIVADPPYSASDAERYGTPMIHRPRVMRTLAQIADRGTHLVWLDTQWPIHRKTEWLTVGRIFLERSTNQRTRSVHIFERQ